MLNGNEKIEVPSKHTPEMVRHEMDSMLGYSEIRLCVGHVVLLAEAKSPYIYGGGITELDLELARKIIKVPGMNDAKFHAALQGELDSAFRPIELFDDGDKTQQEKDELHKIQPFSPEWLADLVRSVCQAVPSVTLHEVIWAMPMVMAMHLYVAECRANGAKTMRPPDYAEAMRRFYAAQKEHK